MRKLYPTIVALLLASSIAAVAQGRRPVSGLDTVQQLPEVEIIQKVYKASALRMNVPIRFVPTPTNRLNEQDLKLRQITDLQEATKQLPSVRTRTTYGGYRQIYIRGFDYSPVLIDGMRDERSAINNSYPFPDIAAAEAVELVKGPAAVLYGRSSEGGIVNIVRKRPTAYRTIDMRLSYGSWNDRRFNAGMGGHLAGGVNYYANLYFSDKEGWRRTGDRRFSSYLALEKTFGNIGLLELRAALSRDHYGTENGLPPNMRWDVYDKKGEIYLHKGEMLPGLDPAVRYNIPDEYIKNKAANVMLQYTHRFTDNIRLSEKIACFDDVIDYKNTSDMMYPQRKDTPYTDGFYYMNKDQKMFIDLSSIYFNNPWFFGYIARSLTNQTELNIDFNTGFVKHHLMAGYAYSRMNRNAFRGYNQYENNKTYGQSIYGTVYNLENPMPINRPDNGNLTMMAAYRRLTSTVDESQGFYLNNLMEFGNHFKLMLSGRYDQFLYRSYMERRESDAMHFYMPPADKMGQTRLGAFSYKAGAVWLPSGTLSFFGSMASFYHPIRDLFNSNGIYINKDGKEFQPKDGGEVFKPESGYQAEIGTRVNIDNRLTFTSSIFYTRKENVKKQLGTVKEAGQVDKTIFGQVGVIAVKGGDVEMHYTPSPQTRITTGYSYVQAQTQEIADNPYLKAESEKGLQLTDVPKNQFYARAAHTVTRGMPGGITFFGSVHYMDKIDRDRSLNISYPAFWQVDVGVSCAITRNLSATLNVYNLLDDKHYEQSIKTQMVPSAPRNLLFTIGYKL